MQELASITITPDGDAHCLYHEAIDLHALGRLECRRASQVEFNTGTQQWEVSLPDSDQPVFSSPSRQACLDWERANLSL